MTEPTALILVFPSRVDVIVTGSLPECVMLGQAFLAWAQVWCLPVGWAV